MTDLEKCCNLALQFHGLDYFLDTPQEDLIMFHETFGRAIRNELRLWDRHWTPEIECGIDCSPDHPDAVSKRLIKEVHKELNKRRDEGLLDV